MSRWAGRTGPELAAAWGVPVVEAYETVGSTSDRAAELGRSGSARPAVVIAEEQTAGRGRRGARWQSEPGAGVWLSILLDGRHAFAQLPLVVAVACVRAVDAVVAPGLVSVKWPNDLLRDGRKVGGILCESGPHGVVVGVGLNTRTPRGGFEGAIATSATSLEVNEGNPLDRNDLANAIVHEILGAVARETPFEAVRDELQARDALRGRRITTERGEGIGQGVDAAGALLLQRSDGVVVPVHAGPVRLTAEGGSE